MEELPRGVQLESAPPARFDLGTSRVNLETSLECNRD
jgi:hypothetical protein